MHTAFIYDSHQCYGSEMHCRLMILCICVYHGNLHGYQPNIDASFLSIILLIVKSFFAVTEMLKVDISI